MGWKRFSRPTNRGAENIRSCSSRFDIARGLNGGEYSQIPEQLTNSQRFADSSLRVLCLSVLCVERGLKLTSTQRDPEAQSTRRVESANPLTFRCYGNFKSQESNNPDLINPVQPSPSSSSVRVVGTLSGARPDGTHGTAGGATGIGRSGTEAFGCRKLSACARFVTSRDA